MSSFFRSKEDYENARRLVSPPVINIPVNAHAALTGLLNDDHTQYVSNGTARTITAQHTFSPATAIPPFVLSANAQGQLVTGLNADKLDGKHAFDSVTTLGADGANIDLSSLDINSHGFTYYLEAFGQQTNNADAIALYLNADYTAGNYSTETLTLNAATLTGARNAGSATVSGAIPANGYWHLAGWLMRENISGICRAVLRCTWDSTGIYGFDTFFQKTATLANITSIRLKSITFSFKSGSRARVWATY